MKLFAPRIDHAAKGRRCSMISVAKASHPQIMVSYTHSERSNGSLFRYQLEYHERRNRSRSLGVCNGKNNGGDERRRG